MRGYWFNQNYGYLTAATTVKFNRKYIGIPFKQKFPGVSDKYNVFSKFNTLENNTCLVTNKYKIVGSIKTLDVLPIVTNKYSVTGKVNIKESNCTLVTKKYRITET